MVYATHEYYANEYGGFLISEEVFQGLSKKASQYVDYFTFGRITEGNASTFPSLADCVCNMAEIIYRIAGKTGYEKEKKSESQDGYSVAYVTESTDGKSMDELLKRKLYAIAQIYLSDTGLLCLECTERFKGV